jgi:hypothetical protein
MEAIAGMAGVLFQLTNSYDYGVDGQFRPVVVRGKRRVATGHPLDFQAKSTINWELADNKIVYDLEAKTYNDIVFRTSSETTLILILLCLPKDQREWHAASISETTLRHCCYWHFFTGEATKNVTSKRIYIPCENILTPENLRILLDLERLRRENQPL